MSSRELPVAGTVLRRVEVRRPSLEKSPPPAPAAPSVKEPTKEKKEEPKEESKESKEPSKEKEAASPPAPEWSKWEPIEGAGWDGHWRAKATEDGGWVYQFTKDFKTIWEQKPVEAAPSAKSSSASASAAASAPPAGEPVRFEETAAPATAIQPLEQPPPSANYEMAGSGCACALCYYDAAAAASAAALSSLPGDVAALTVSGNREASYLHHYEYTQAATTTEIPPAAAEQGLVAAGQASYPAAAVNPSQEVSHRHSPGAASAARSRGSKKSSRHYSHSTHKSAHHRAHGPDKAAHNPKEIGDVVSAEKEKKYDPKRIVDNWVWEWGYGA
ncbi:hypothetical protein SLS63_009440 [Diaporthe eres]|uniref:WW domain-containing protein n=1 Tax=Diaporthe eres TaxID=83184 RepID=A0ABR1NZL8_DIAER